MDQLNYSPGDFVEPEFAAECADCFDAFIELIIEGVPRDLAIIDAFQMIKYSANIGNADALAMAAQCNPYVKTRLAARLKDAKPTDLWSEKKAINHLLAILKSEKTRGADKIAAIDRLNVLLDITVIDEAGRTKKVPTLDDLYPDDPKPEGENRPTTH
ncbi:hypothetical protein IAG25_25460 [Caballeronia sp. EK]|uniref:hypothetical protein n=1 Tax=Caballeronia sp. EK TaxID=2767469 RepID=UPI0016556618|nr:hypothetical protein [Caballeronia sp. EK]MBC8640183.1 hypothetical protein [Caballeronia sp. EK]